MLKATSRQGTVHHRLGAEQENERGRYFADILDGVLPPCGQQGRVEGAAHIGRQLFFPLNLNNRFDSGGLHRMGPHNSFNHELLALGAAIELLVDLVPQERTHHRGDQKI